MKTEITAESVKQGCAICGQHRPKMVLDYDHATGQLYGVLCLRCNALITRYQGSIDLLRRAIAYLLQRETDEETPSEGT